jgi:hypothetical protein
MSPRARLLSFGGAAATVVFGAIAGIAIGGISGGAVAIALISLGAIAIVSLVFLEVGLSEDRDRARTQRRLPRPRRPPRRRRSH